MKCREKESTNSDYMKCYYSLFFTSFSYNLKMSFNHILILFTITNTMKLKINGYLVLHQKYFALFKVHCQKRVILLIINIFVIIFKLLKSRNLCIIVTTKPLKTKLFLFHLHYWNLNNLECSIYVSMEFHEVTVKSIQYSQ